MQVYVNKISGIDDAIVSMYMSKRSWTREKEEHIREVCRECLTDYGALCSAICVENPSHYEEFAGWLQSLVKWGKRHQTLLRFIEISATVEGLHRGGQDDWDSHAKRFDNRIIRSSTRLAKFGHEKSKYYQDKILTTDEALNLMGIELPETFTDPKGDSYVRKVNGYVKEDCQTQDVERGLYMLSIPSNFIFKINLTEWAHVYKERNAKSSANPEVKECCEAISDMIEAMIPQFNRTLFEEIPN